MSTVSTITSAALVARIAMEGAGTRCKISESFYEDGVNALPLLLNIESVILPSFKEWQIHEGIWRNWKIKFDCDDYALAFMYFTARCFANTREVTDADGYARWRISYKIDGDPARGHKINEALTDKGFIFIEPQTAQIVQLTKEEEASIWFRNS